MKVKWTLHEVYNELKRLREERDRMGRLAMETYIEGEISSFEHFTKRYKYYDEAINHLSQIEVEFENKYVHKED